jgi:type II secretory pathway component PulM
VLAIAEGARRDAAAQRARGRQARERLTLALVAVVAALVLIYALGRMDELTDTSREGEAKF